MATAGKIVTLDNGKRGTLSSGKIALFNDDGECRDCCCDPCTPHVLASHVTNSSNPTWDLTPYQGPDQAPTCSYWRLIETGYCYPRSYPWYGAGCVDETGRLVGLPDSFTSHYYYNGYLSLQIGCLNSTGTAINWPGTCQTTSGVFSC